MSDPFMRLEHHRIHRALSRANLLLGADRELVLVSGLASAILVFVVLTPTSVVIGTVFWIGMIGILRMMAKTDPMMRQVYRRHLRYRHAYRPTASPWLRS